MEKRKISREKNLGEMNNDDLKKILLEAKEDIGRLEEIKEELLEKKERRTNKNKEGKKKNSPNLISEKNSINTKVDRDLIKEASVDTTEPPKKEKEAENNIDGTKIIEKVKPENVLSKEEEEETIPDFKNRLEDLEIVIDQKEREYEKLKKKLDKAHEIIEEKQNYHDLFKSLKEGDEIDADNISYKIIKRPGLLGGNFKVREIGENKIQEIDIEKKRLMKLCENYIWYLNQGVWGVNIKNSGKSGISQMEEKIAKLSEEIENLKKEKVELEIENNAPDKNDQEKRTPETVEGGENTKEVVDNINKNKLEAQDEKTEEDKTISPEKMKNLGELMTQLEKGAEERLNSPELKARIKKGVMNGLTSWETFGQGEEGPKGFIKRTIKTSVNLALIAAISSVSIEKLAKTGIVSASVFTGGVTHRIASKLLIGLGMGTTMDICKSYVKNEKIKKYLPKVIMYGGVAVAVGLSAASTGGLSVVVSGLSLAAGIARSKLNKGIYSNEYISNKKNAALEALVKKYQVPEQAGMIDFENVKKFESEYNKIIKRYENMAIWGKALNEGVNILSGAAVSTFAMTASGISHNIMHHDTVDNSHVETNAKLNPELKHEDTTNIKDENNDIPQEDHQRGFMSKTWDKWFGGHHKPETEVVKSAPSAQENDTEEYRSDDMHKLENAGVSVKPEQQENISENGNDTEEYRSDDMHKLENSMTPEELKHQQELNREEFLKNQEKDYETKRDELYSNDKAELESQRMHEDEMRKDNIAKANLSETNPEQPEVKNELNADQMKDIIVHKGEGIEHTFIRQIEHNHDLARDLGYKGDFNDTKALHDFAGREAHIIAIKEGYVDAGGNEVRIAVADKIGYEVKVEDGHVVVNERSIEGDILETHHEGDKFEENPDKGEYIRHHEVKAGSFADAKDTPTETDPFADAKNIPTEVDPFADAKDIPVVNNEDLSSAQVASGAPAQEVPVHMGLQYDHSNVQAGEQENQPDGKSVLHDKIDSAGHEEILHRVHTMVQKDIEHIFPNEESMDRFNHINNTVPAYRMLDMYEKGELVQNTELGNEFGKLGENLTKIVEATGKTPEIASLANGFQDEPIKDFMERAINDHFKETGKMIKL